MYQIEFDEKIGLMRIKKTGFWNSETMAAYVVELLAKTEVAAKSWPKFKVLVDASEFPVQSAEISDALGHIMRIGAEGNVGRAAVILDSTLSKLQSQRQFRHPTIGNFLKKEEALAWLYNEQSA